MKNIFLLILGLSVFCTFLKGVLDVFMTFTQIHNYDSMLVLARHNMHSSQAGNITSRISFYGTSDAKWRLEGWTCISIRRL